MFAMAVGDSGHVYSYERRTEFSALAQRNVARAGLSHRVTFKVRDIAEGFDERDADVVFLDVREPWLYLKQAGTAWLPTRLSCSSLASIAKWKRR